MNIPLLLLCKPNALCVLSVCRGFRGASATSGRLGGTRSQFHALKPTDVLHRHLKSTYIGE